MKEEINQEINPVISLSELKKENFNKLKKWKEEEYSKIRSDLGLILEGQKINQKDLRLGFIGLATQNSELLELNKKLSQQLERVEKELNVLKKEREEKAARKEARANRKRLPKRQPITPEIYRLLIQAAESPTYTSVRLRIALFETKLSSHQFQVLFEIIKVYSSNDIRKEFHIQQFLDNYSFVLSSQQKKKIKDHFIRYLQVLNQQHKLRDKVIDLSSNKILNIQDLNTSHLNIAVFESIDIKFT